MRIVEPNRRMRTRRRRSKQRALLLGSLVCIFFGVLWFFRQDVPAPQESIEAAETTTENSDTVDTTTPRAEPQLIEFADNAFKTLYENTLLPNLERIENPPVISGNDLADTRIRDIAEKRGYQLRYLPIEDLVVFEGSYMQPTVVEPWQKLRALASEAGLELSIVSAFRSVDYQRGLFLQRLGDAGASIDSVAAGESDIEVDFVLKTSSIPGYSKHHTGYTLDLQCGGYAFENFINSPCQSWIAADNYKVAKELGFIPSYPPQADAQGPDPEAWEYVWVGTDVLYTTTQ